MMKDGGHYNIRAENGLSLVELMVVVAIICIMASLAVMQRGNANQQFQRQNVAGELKVAFERARFDSVKRRAVAPADPDEPGIRAYVLIEASRITLRIDRDQNGILNAADDQAYPFPIGVVAGGYGFAIPEGGMKVAFNQRGEADILASVNSPQFMICNGASCPSFPGDASTTNTVLVTATGTVNLLHGGVAIPTFTDPTVANPAVDIREEVVLP